VFEINKKSVILLMVAALSLGAAGCGGGDDSEEAPETAPVTTTDTATSVTQDELIFEGDNICAEVNAAVGTIDSSTTADETIKETQIADIYAGLAESLEGLGTPTDGEAPTEVIEAAQTLADSSSIDGDTALAEFQAAATDYGFTECGEAPAAPSSSGDGSTVVPPTDSSTTPVPVEPAPAPVPVEPAPVAPEPPAAGGGVVPDAPAPAPPSGGGSSSGGLTPG